VRRADLILLLENGHVIERGTHEALMTNQGMYYEMVMRQMESASQDAEQVLSG
jgi:ABC-type multidrug transport system fused ATPase/permease subunit